MNSNSACLAVICQKPTSRFSFVSICLRSLLTAVFVVSSLSFLDAQTSATSFSGKVLDPSKGAITGASIVVIPQGRAAGPTAVSDQNGEFILRLEPGKYTVKVSARSFLDVSQLVEISSTPQSHDFLLPLAAVGQTVDVVGDAGYQVSAISSATKTLTPLRDVPQSITVVTDELIEDQGMMSIADVVRYVPGIEVHQGENNRDQLIIRGNSTSADFFLNGVRDDVQYYRDIYNLDRVEALRGPNAMIFGRGGGGGVLNRVAEEANFMPVRAFTLQGGSYGNKRVTGDLGQRLNDKFAVRFNGMYENSDSFREGVGLERVGINPTMTFALSKQTRVTGSYEYLHDTRVADRGITSYQGRPVSVDPSTYYGNPDDSHVRADVHLATGLFERYFSQFTLRNRTMFGDYDRFYQNYVPGATSTDGSTVALTAYNNATKRKNVFNQTDLIATTSTGSIRHTLLFGAEFGQQLTDNFRNTGFFNNTATTMTVPSNVTTISTPVTFRQLATDANSHLRTNLAAGFVQDQVELSRFVQLIGGVRFDHFDLTYHNNRNNDELTRTDNLVSPRAGIVVKPVTHVSLYGSYSVSYLPSSGDQFSSLTVITQQVEPEKFNNYESGVKWDIIPALSITAAGYRLDRTNTRSTDPNDPTRIVQTGSQRTNGFEWSATGKVTSKWQIVGNYTYQDAFVTSATTAATEGAQAGQVPHHIASMWNNYKIHPRLGAALGLISRSGMFATIDNTVRLPGYLRADAALFINLGENLRLQGNLENLSNIRYTNNADSNTNISPGSPRAIRIGLTGKF